MIPLRTDIRPIRMFPHGLVMWTIQTPLAAESYVLNEFVRRFCMIVSQFPFCRRYAFPHNLFTDFEVGHALSVLLQLPLDPWAVLIKPILVYRLYFFDRFQRGSTTIAVYNFVYVPGACVARQRSAWSKDALPRRQTASRHLVYHRMPGGVAAAGQEHPLWSAEHGCRAEPRLDKLREPACRACRGLDRSASGTRSGHMVGRPRFHHSLGQAALNVGRNQAGSKRF